MVARPPASRQRSASHAASDAVRMVVAKTWEETVWRNVWCVSVVFRRYGVDDGLSSGLGTSVPYTHQVQQPILANVKKMYRHAYNQAALSSISHSIYTI